MNRKEIAAAIQRKGSFLCVGLDSEAGRIPAHLRTASDPVFEFNKAIIDATKDHCVAYKINTAFYEAGGPKGWESMEKALNYIPKDIFRIADAKRGDIGNTAAQYAKAFFEALPFDAITLSPYMGEDSIRPFLEHEGKWAILLGLTSNKGAADFELLETTSGKRVYEEVLEKSSRWGTADNMMYVAGATRAEQIGGIREVLPEHFLLVPGIGAQGGSLEDTAKFGLNEDCGLLVNSSRDIIFAGLNENFASEASRKAKEMQLRMQALLEEYKSA
jgi:orotidine-5'-phosphate decarboxylase